MALNSNIMMLLGANLWEKILIWYQNSLLKELVEYLGSTVFHVEFSTYENFSLSGGIGGTVRNIILGLMVGTALAAGMMFYTRNVQGRFVRALLKGESFSPERAMTLRETGMFRNTSVRRELSRSGVLSKLTRCVEEENFDSSASKKPFEPDFMTAHFYIPEDLKYRAEVRYDRKGSGLPQLVLTVVACLVVAVVLCRFLPSLLGLADWLMTALAP